MPKTNITPLSVTNVSVSYDGSTPVISDINITTKPGHFYGLIGLNGSGKTTLIKAILGLRQPDSGTISVFDKPSTDKDSKKKVAFLPERFEPPWFLSGIEFLRFSTKLYGRKSDDKSFYEYAEKLALDTAALSRKVQTYSKGMRQKLGLLGTIMTGCELLILDEPMSGLDPKARTHVKDMLMALKKENKTIFISSHILADMNEICDEVSILNNGKIRFTGTPSSLLKDTKRDNLERAFLDYIEKRQAA